MLPSLVKATEQNRADIVQQHAGRQVMQLGLNPKKLVFLYETSAKTNITRLYGRAPIGGRLVDRTPHGHWVTTTYVCGLTRKGIVAPHTFVGAMNAARFVEYITALP